MLENALACPLARPGPPHEQYAQWHEPDSGGAFRAWNCRSHMLQRRFFMIFLLRGEPAISPEPQEPLRKQRRFQVEEHLHNWSWLQTEGLWSLHKIPCQRAQECERKVDWRRTRMHSLCLGAYYFYTWIPSTFLTQSWCFLLGQTFPAVSAQTLRTRDTSNCQRLLCFAWVLWVR